MFLEPPSKLFPTTRYEKSVACKKSQKFEQWKHANLGIENIQKRTPKKKISDFDDFKRP